MGWRSNHAREQVAEHTTAIGDGTTRRLTITVDVRESGRVAVNGVLVSGNDKRFAVLDVIMSLIFHFVPDSDSYQGRQDTYPRGHSTQDAQEG